MTTDFNNVFANIDFSPLFDGVLKSIRAISDSGINLMFWIAGIIILAPIIRHYVRSTFIDKQVKKRSAMRQVFKADYENNLDDMIDDNVRKNELRLLSNKRMFEKNKSALVTDRLNNMELNHEARLLFDESHHKNRKALVTERLMKMEINNDAKLLFDEKHKKSDDELVNDRVHNMEINHKAELLFHENNPDAYYEKHDLYYSQAQEYYKSRGHK